MFLFLIGCSPEFTPENPCPHRIEYWDSYSGYCWCDLKSCQPSKYKPKKDE